MKKTILILLTAIGPLLAHAQHVVANIIDSYSGKDGYTTVTVTRPMLDLFNLNGNDSSANNFKKATEGIDCIKVLSKEVNGAKTSGNDFYRNISKEIPMIQFEVLMEVNDAGNPVKFLIRKNGNKIIELVMLCGGDDPCLMVIEGTIDLNKISYLSNAMRLKGVSKFRSLWPGY